MEDVLAAKAALRHQVITARRRMDGNRRAIAGRQFRDALLDLPQLQMAGTVAAYYSSGAEPETHGLLFALWKRGTYVILPILAEDSDLDWASYEGPDSLVQGGKHSLMEPGEPPRGPQAIARADVVIVPALAADLEGNRLGRGGGSYDRALARVNSNIPVIALLYDSELLESVPALDHDRKVTAVARPEHGVQVL